MGCTEWRGSRGNPLNKMRVVVNSLAAFFLLLSLTGTDAQRYYGKRIGQLSQLQHSVKGEVYAVDSRTIHIKGFSYDGTAPDAFFYAGKTGTPSENGVIIPDENGRRDPLGAYSNRDVTITLPDGMTLKDIAWLSVWCRAFSIDFGSLTIPRGLEYPRPQKIDGFPTLEHGVKSDKIVVVDAQTFLIPDFHYDGEAPDAFFWVGQGTKPDSKGLAVPDENGGREPIRRYAGKTIVITLPDSMTVFDIDYLGVWCKSFSANFGHVIIPRGLNIPPSLKMLGVAPQKLSTGHSNLIPTSFNNQLPLSASQGQFGFEHPSNAGQKFFSQKKVPQNSIAQDSFLQPQRSFFQQPTPNNLQLSSSSFGQPQLLSQFPNPQQSFILTPSFESNFKSNLIPQIVPSNPIPHAELAFSSHRFGSPSSQFGQANVPINQFNQPSSSHFNEPSLVTIPSSQFNQQSSHGNAPSRQFNQQSSFAKAPSNQFNQQSLVGNVPFNQFNQQSSFVNVPSNQFSQQSTIGNIPSNQFNQKSSFGNVPAQRFSQTPSINIPPSTQVNHFSTFQNVPSQQFIQQTSSLNNVAQSNIVHQASPLLNNAFQSQSNQHSSSFSNNPSANFNQQPSFGHFPTTIFNQPSFANIHSSSFGSLQHPETNSRTPFDNDPSIRVHQDPKHTNALFIHNQFHSHLSPKIVRDINFLNSDSGVQESSLHQPINNFNSLQPSGFLPSNRQNNQAFKTQGPHFQTDGLVTRPAISKSEPINHFTITNSRPSFLAANNNFNAGINDFNRNTAFRRQRTLQTDSNRNNLRATRGDTLRPNADARTTVLLNNLLAQTHETESGSGNLRKLTAHLDQTNFKIDSKQNAFTVHRLKPQAFDEQEQQSVRRHQLSLSLANPTSQSSIKPSSRTHATILNNKETGGFIPLSPIRNFASDAFDGSHKLAPSSSSFAITHPERNLEISAKGNKIQNSNSSSQTGPRNSSHKATSSKASPINVRERSHSTTKAIIKRSERSPEHVTYNEESANTNSYSKVLINNGGHKMSYTIYV